ncbi:MAG: universal stress protein [Acidimicrobiales bacterium]|nr:universal stress protein [Acidimicrobiales bacterium]
MAGNKGMFNTIVVATDGSENAAAAVRTACDLKAGAPEAEMHVLTAYHAMTPAEINELKDALPDEFAPLLHADYVADERIEAAKQMVKAAGLSATYHEIRDNPADAILDLADLVKADLIVVGSRGHGIGQRLIHGSVSTKVLHHAQCSVLVVKL